MNKIYLDNAASTAVLPQVREKLNKVLDIYGNPSSIHEMGQQAKNLILESKDIISKKLNCDEDELYFTSGASMSNSVILTGFLGNIIVSDIEHEDIQLIRKEYNTEYISVDRFGSISIKELECMVENCKERTLFSIQMANGEIGSVQDTKMISEIIHKNENCYLHVDATQYIPYFPIDVKELGIDALSMSGQKIGCIKGIGLLYVSNKLIEYVHPIIYGEQGLIGGTENVFGIACLGEAFKQLKYDNDELINKRNYLIQRLNGKLIGAIKYRLPNNIDMYFKGVDSQQLVTLMSEYGIYISAGSACSSGNSEPSHVLKAIGLTDEQANNCVRLTLSKDNTYEELDITIKTLNDCCEILRTMKGDQNV